MGQKAREQFGLAPTGHGGDGLKPPVLGEGQEGGVEHDLVRAMVQHCRLTLAKVARPLGLGDTVTELDWLISRVVSAPVDTTVRTELMRRGWPQQRLAALAGLHQSTVSRRLAGHCGVHPPSRRRSTEWPTRSA